MRFCTRCNQERTGDNRFCTVCGTEFLDSPDGGPAKEAAAATETFAIPRTPAATEHQSTQLSAPGAGNQPVAWDQPTGRQQAPQQPASWGQPADPFATQTVFSPQADYPPAAPPASPGYPGQYQPGGYPPSGAYPPAGPGLPDQFPPPGDYPRGPGQSRSGKTVALVAGAIVVVAAAGAGAFALVSSLHSSGSTARQPTAQATSAPATTPASQAQSPTTAPPTSSAAPTSGQPGTVTLASAAASSPYASHVQTLFNTYFDGINTHNYAEFASTLDAGMQAKNPQSTFDSGYATTTDSSETITSISGSASGLTAVVTFTSRQAPSDSPDKSACNNYRLTLPLVPQGSGYVITAPPSGYATYSDC